MRLTTFSIIIFFILVSIAFAATETPIGIFNVSNVAPGAPFNWSPLTTHYKNQISTWTEGFDANGDAVSTYICITNDTDTDQCTVVNTQSASPSYTFTQAESFWDYNWSYANRTYYVKLTSNDGTVNGTVNDTIYFILFDNIPVIVSATTDAANDGDKDIGETVTFNLTSYTDADSDDNHSLRVCFTDSITTSGACGAGEWCNETPFKNQTTFSCTELLDDSGEPNNLNYANFYVCDCPPYDQSCPGQCSQNFTLTFYVNHAPNASNVLILPLNPSVTDNLSCNYTFSDSDGDSEGNTTFKWFKDNVLQAGLTSQNITSGNTTAAEQWICEVTPFDEHNFSGTAVNSTISTIAGVAPTFTVPTQDYSTASNPTNEGDNVTFNATAVDPSSQNYTLFVCYTNNITGAQCEAGQQVCNSSFVISGSPAVCFHDTTGELNQNYTWYSFVCDTDNNCSTNENSNSPYHVNHRPNATNVNVTPSFPNTNQDLTCNYTFNDIDNDADTSTFKWFNYTAPTWTLTSFTTQILGSGNTTIGETWLCEVTPIDEHSFAGTAVNSTNATIQNRPPNKPANFKVRDGVSSWDGTPVIDTHDVTPDINWTASDNDTDPVSTYVCIANTLTERNANNCSAFSTFNASTNVNSVSGLDYNGTSRTYYVRLTPNDGTENGTSLDTQFAIINSLPTLPNNLTPTTTHDPTPTLSWAVTDDDDGSVDGWPADSLTHHIRIGATCGSGTYHSNDVANNNTEVSATLPWGTPGPVWANNTFCVSVWADDSHIGGIGSNLTQNLTLFDYLPDITDIEVTDAGSAYSSCTTSTCAISPVEHNYSTVAARVTTIDTDNDCAPSNSTTLIYLCLSTSPCLPPANFSWQVDNVVRTGSNCTYTFNTNKTQSDGTPAFFRTPSTSYTLYVNASSQAGSRTTDSEANDNWQYNSLIAVDYPSIVFLGDGFTDLGEWNNGTSLAVMTNWGNVILNSSWNSSDPTSGSDTWNLNGTDMQLDDDNATFNEANGPIAPTYLDATLSQFQAASGLQRCDVFACSSASLNETLDTYYHIAPPLGLLAGTYNSTITIELTQK